MIDRASHPADKSMRLALPTWLLLAGVTLLSYMIARGDQDGVSALDTALVLIFACVKIVLIGLVFMELAHAPAFLRRILFGYCALLCAGLVFLTMRG